MIPGWPYSVVAALEPGRTSWTAVLDAVRRGPDDDETEVTAAQVRGVVTRLIAAGHWRDGDPAILVVFDAGYDVTRLAWLLADLPAELPGRLRSDRVMWLPAPPRRPGTNGRPRKHGRELAPSDPAACPDLQIATSTATSRYGTAVAAAWDQVHPRLTHRAGASPMPASGRSAAMAPTASTPSSWAGSPSTAPCASPSSTAHPADRGRRGSSNATRSRPR
jgi:hypothetical protein